MKLSFLLPVAALGMIAAPTVASASILHHAPKHAKVKAAKPAKVAKVKTVKTRTAKPS